MKQFISNNKKSITAIAVCIALAGISVSFQTMQFGPLQQFDSITDVPEDTIPAKEKTDNLNMKEFSDLMQHLNVDMKKAVQEVSKIDMEKISEEIKSSLKEVDAEKIKKQINEALKAVDMASIQNEMNKAFKEIEWNKINDEVKMALDKASREIEHIDMKEVNEQLAKAKVEIEKAKAELKKIDLEKTFKEAGKSLQIAEKYLKLQKEMFIEMEKDGLINLKDGFSIRYKNKQLFINGKQQPDAVADKYHRYIQGDNYEITIDKE